MKNLLLIITLSMLSCQSPAQQPSEAQIKKDLMNSNVIDITFTKSTGTRQWNSDLKNYEYVRGVIIRQKSFDYPKYNIILEGDAVYQSTGNSYTYWKFRTTNKSYEGIPNPTAAEINKTIAKDWKKFYGYYFNKIIKLEVEPHLTDSPKWEWGNPMNVTFNMEYKAEIISDNITVETIELPLRLQMYRDSEVSEWNGFIVSPGEKKVLNSKTLPEDQVRKMRQNTLAFTIYEKTANETANNLPKVDVPNFKNMDELADYIHNILLTGNAETLEAVLMRTISLKMYFNPGSTVQLNQAGANIINTAAQNAYSGDMKYKDQYCKTYEKGSLSSSKHIYITGCVPKVTTMISGVQEDNGYKDGVAQKGWKITKLEVVVRQDDDALNYVNSFSDKKKLCPND